MKVARQTLNNLLKEIADLMKVANNKEDAIKLKQKHYLALEYNSVYGGYRTINVGVDDGAHCGAFGENGCEARLSAKDMYIKLNGILTGLNLQVTK